MLYIKIGNEKYPCKIGTFTTQLGNDAIRIKGDVPLAEDGFLIVDEEDNIIADKSEYKYLYREDDTCKEYTKVAEAQIPTQSFAMGDVPPSGYDILSRRINAVNSRVSDITPFTMSKQVGIDEYECFFDYRDGNISAWLVTADGQESCEYEIIDGKIRVFFEPLTEVATINISIQ